MKNDHSDWDHYVERIRIDRSNLDHYVERISNDHTDWDHNVERIMNYCSDWDYYMESYIITWLAHIFQDILQAGWAHWKYA